MTQEQLRAFVQRLKEYATSAPTLSSKLNADSDKIKPRTSRVPSAKKALLDSI